jgi:hypothetical protein
MNGISGGPHAQNVAELVSAPAYSEFLKRDNVRHTWICTKCDYEFETLIWLNIPPGARTS